MSDRGSAVQRALLFGVIAVVLIGALVISCSRQGFSPSSKDTLPSISATYTALAVQPPTNSFVFVNETNVEYINWLAGGSGQVVGNMDQINDLSAGSPTFLTSTGGFTGTDNGKVVTIQLPSLTLTLTVSGVNLLEQQTDPQSGKLIDMVWVPATRTQYDTLVTAFRSFTSIGQDISGINFELTTAKTSPSPSIAGQVKMYLSDLQSQVATLHTLSMPKISGLQTPWVIANSRIQAAEVSAELYLGTPTP